MLGKIVLALSLHAALVSQALAVDCKSESLVQSEMNDCAERDFLKADALLNARYKKIVGCLKDGARALVEAQRAWIQFRDAECKFQGSASEGGRSSPWRSPVA